MKTTYKIVIIAEVESQDYETALCDARAFVKAKSASDVQVNGSKMTFRVAETLTTIHNKNNS